MWYPWLKSTQVKPDVVPLRGAVSYIGFQKWNTLIIMYLLVWDSTYVTPNEKKNPDFFCKIQQQKFNKFFFFSFFGGPGVTIGAPCRDKNRFPDRHYGFLG